MNAQSDPLAMVANLPVADRPEKAIALLVGQIYEAAPSTEKSHLIDYLLRPLGLLALVGVAQGAFGQVWLRNPRGACTSKSRMS